MDNRINILSELQSVSPTVAAIAPVNPYQVPEGYFESLAPQILALLHEPEYSVLTSAAKNPYTVPQGYFDNLPGEMLSLVRDDAPAVLKLKPSNPYNVPNGYFENLAENILRRVKAQEDLSPKEELESLSPLLSKLGKTSPFTLPEGYFDDLSGNVVAGMKAIDFVNEELENLSPLMNSFRSKNVYEVPAKYFDDLPESILSKVKERKPAKVVSIGFGKKILRYAAAAVVLGVVITAGVLFMNRQNEPVNSGSIVQTEQNLQAETQNELKTLTDDELLNFIENHPTPLPELSFAASDELDQEAVQLMLADIPDAELKRYLLEHGDVKEL